MAPTSAPRVSLSADFLHELGEVLVRHGHDPAHGSVPGAVSYAMHELSAFVRAYRDAPAPMGRDGARGD